jgi:hypothetical protein
MFAQSGTSCLVASIQESIVCACPLPSPTAYRSKFLVCALCNMTSQFIWHLESHENFQLCVCIVKCQIPICSTRRNPCSLCVHCGVYNAKSQFTKAQVHYLKLHPRSLYIPHNFHYIFKKPLEWFRSRVQWIGVWFGSWGNPTTHKTPSALLSGYSLSLFFPFLILNPHLLSIVVWTMNAMVYSTHFNSMVQSTTF